MSEDRELIKTAPARIYLQVSEDVESFNLPFPDSCGDEITWCADSVLDCEVEYVRADVSQASQSARMKELEAENARLREALEVVKSRTLIGFIKHYDRTLYDPGEPDANIPVFTLNMELIAALNQKSGE